MEREARYDEFSALVVTRFPFLDWMRGLAVVIMIQCHVFNSFTRLDLRQSGAYIFSQFVGGLAAPLFLFMAGMTSGFQMDRLEQRALARRERWAAALRRAGYIVLIAYLFRLTNWLGSLPRASLQELLKVDILNCMGLAMVVFSLAAVSDFRGRIRYVTAAASLVAAAAPVVSALDWSAVPAVVKYYLVPGGDRAQFPFFPCAAYLGFGVAAGSLVKRAASFGGPDGIDRLMRWLALGGLGSILVSEYFVSLPYSMYPKVDFWRNSPALIFIRVGIMLLMLTGSYLWTGFLSGADWSWVQSLGKTSLLVYWVHVMLVYGGVAAPLKRSLTPAGSALAAILVMLLMTGLAEVRLRQKARKQVRWKAATTIAGGVEA
jgi:uncharacterized membrane protein